MHPGKIPAFFGFGFICMLVSGSIVSTKPLHAQNQQTQNAAPSGISVPVKMIDPVDSQTDPAGKQYRASVAKAVNAGSGVQIPQGTPATVVLAQGANGWSTQLTSLTVGGQAIAVTSSSASVTSAAQNAAATAANAVGSVFGGFGHHAPPAAVTAVAVGQRVVLPPGVTLTFVVATPGAAGGAAPAVDAAPAANPAPEATAAAPAPTPAAGPAPNPAPVAAVAAPAANGRYVFCFTGHPANPPTNAFTNATEPVTYFSDVFPEPSIGLHVTVDWNAFLQKGSMPQGACQDRVGLSVAQAGKQQMEDARRNEKKQIVETGWKNAPAAAAATNAAAATSQAVATAPPTGAANEYYVYCNSAAMDGPVYFSDIFAFNETVADGRGVSIELAGPFLQFLKQKYAVKVVGDYPATWNGGSYPTNCSQSFAPLAAAQKDKQQLEDNVTKNLHRQVIESSWKTTIVPLPAVTAPPAAANEYYVSCFSNSDHGLPTAYFSEIFAAVPTGAPIRDAFLAFLQKKYGFNDPRPAPVDCDQSPKPGNADMFKNAWAIRQNREGLAKVNKKQVVETGWKYTP